jgi:hypothetical protein
VSAAGVPSPNRAVSAGGLCGSVNDDYYNSGSRESNTRTIFANSYSTGGVLASASGDSPALAYVGGVCGTIGANSPATVAVSDCYWNSASARQIGDKEGSDGALTAAQMKEQSNYSGFAFGLVWSIAPAINDGYPTLTSDQTARPPYKAIGLSWLQGGWLDAGKPGEVSYVVSTAGIVDGSYEATVTGLPAGVTFAGPITISDGKGKLTLTGDESTISGDYRGLILTIDDTPSWIFELYIISTTKRVSVGAQSGSLTAGAPATVSFPVTTVGIADGSYPATVENLPSGVTVRGQVTIANNAGRLTLAGDATTEAGWSYPTLIIANTRSYSFPLTILASGGENTPVTSVVLPEGLTLAGGQTASLLATVAPTGASDRSLVWSSSDSETVSVAPSVNGFIATVTAKKTGTATITATNLASGLSASCQVTVVAPYPGSLRLTSAYSLVTAGAGEPIALRHGWDSDEYTITGMGWEYQKDGGAWSEAPPTGFTISDQLDGADVKDGLVITVAAGVAPGTYRVRATTPSGPGANAARLAATATIKVLEAASGEPAGGQAVLLETAVTANPALKVSATVPFRVLDPAALAAVNATLASPGKEVRLYTNYGKANEVLLTREVNGIAATLRDGRTLELVTGKNDSDLWTSAKSFKGVTVVVGSGENELVLDKTLNIAVKTVYPKLTFATDRPLNAFYPDSAATLTATADTGARVTVEGLEALGNAGESLEATGKNGLKVASSGKAKAGNHKFAATVSVEGYKAVTNSPSAPNKVAVSVRLLNERPKLKLTSNTVTLGRGGDYNYGSASFQILSSDPARTLEEWGGLDAAKSEVWTTGKNAAKVEGLFSFRRDGTVTINYNQDKQTPKGKYQIRAVLNSDSGGSAPLNLNLTVKWADYGSKKPSFKLSPATVTVNADPAKQSDVFTVAVVPSAANLNYSWAADQAALTAAGFAPVGSPARNSLGLRISGTLAPGSKARLAVNSTDRAFAAQTLTINVPAASKKASFTLSQKGRIDLLDQDSALAVTAKFANTTPRIKEVGLYADEGCMVESPLFAVVTAAGSEAPKLAGNTFFVKAKGPLEEGRKPQTVYVKLTFVDTNETSPPSLTGKLTIKPGQGSAKARASRSSLTLYALQPDAGEELALSLTSSVNGAALGAARLAKASEDLGFELVRSGQGAWELGFKNGVAPANPNKSYTLTLELWPEGTYKPDQDGGIEYTYGSGATAAKPATVKVKVNVRP